jgi:hypothetical protein
MLVGSVSVPVGTARAGKYRLPVGLVMYSCPVRDARVLPQQHFLAPGVFFRSTPGADQMAESRRA